MAATPLTVNRISLTGIEPPAEGAFDVVNGMVLNNNDGKKLWVEVTNTHATDVANLVITTPGEVGGNPIGDKSIAVPANSEKRRYGPFPIEVYGKSVVFNKTGTGTLTISAWQI